MQRTPPLVIASRALMQSWSTALSIWIGSTSAGHDGPCWTRSRFISAPMIPSIRSCMDSTSAATSVTWGRRVLAPRERQQAADEPATLLRRADDLARERAAVFVGNSFLGEEPRIAGDDGQQIVELMRDPGGEVPDGLKSLRLSQLFLAGPPGRDVGEVPDKATALARGGAQDRGPRLDERHRSVGAMEPEFVRPLLGGARERSAQSRQDPRAVRRMNAARPEPRVERPRSDGVAEGRRRTFAPPDRLARAVPVPGDVGCRPGQQAEALLALDQRLLGLLVSVDVRRGVLCDL